MLPLPSSTNNVALAATQQKNWSTQKQKNTHAHDKKGEFGAAQTPIEEAAVIQGQPLALLIIFIYIYIYIFLATSTFFSIFSTFFFWIDLDQRSFLASSLIKQFMIIKLLLNIIIYIS